MHAKRTYITGKGKKKNETVNWKVSQVGIHNGLQTCQNSCFYSLFFGKHGVLCCKHDHIHAITPLPFTVSHNYYSKQRTSELSPLF